MKLKKISEFKEEKEIKVEGEAFRYIDIIKISGLTVKNWEKFYKRFGRPEDRKTFEYDEIEKVIGLATLLEIQPDCPEPDCVRGDCWDTIFHIIFTKGKTYLVGEVYAYFHPNTFAHKLIIYEIT